MRPARKAISFALAAAVLTACAAAAAPAARTRLIGRSLTEALQLLQEQGLPVFFSSSVVRESMRVDAEPRGASPREILDEILRPHGLRAEELEGRLIVVAKERAPAPRKQAPAKLEPLPVIKEEIFVTAGRREARSDGSAGFLSLEPAQIEELPHLGDDVFRAIGLMPGAATSEASSQVQVRGGRDDEVLVVLDGLELLSPYHLPEFDRALSIVAPTLLDRVDLSTGGYPAEYGDRMSGVVEMTTLTPPRALRFELGLGLLYGETSASGSLPGDRGRWYGAARKGTYRLALELNGRAENPRYSDVFGKLELSLRPNQTLRLNALSAEDEYFLSAADELGNPASELGGERYRGRWGNRYLWLTHGALLGSDLFVESMASAGRIDRDRSGSRTKGEPLEVTDHRLLDVANVKQVWRLQPEEGYLFEGGVELKRLHSNIRYRSDRTKHQGILEFDRTGAFLSSRLRPFGFLTAEIGARHDYDSLTGEGDVSPRLNLAWQPQESHRFRLAWGWFHQSQRPNELQVEDGETELAAAERAEHRIFGYEHRRESGATFQMEAYQRRLRRPRVRFENLFDSISLFPELAGDRVRIAPDGGQAEGIELSFRGAARGPLSWWLAYSWSSIEDHVDGRKVPRADDQPHAVRADLNYRTRNGWNLNAAWQYHTGFPTTLMTGRAVLDPDGSVRIEPVLGPLYGERLPDYHRLDLRLSRAWTLPRGGLSAYLDLQNVYDRENVRGFDDFTFALGTAGDVRVESETLSWGGFLPSFGIRWQL